LLRTSINKDRSPAVGLLFAVVLLVAVALSGALSAGRASGSTGSTTIFSDGFESGSFSAWSPGATTAADGSATVQSTTVKSGSYAARLSESATSGSKAYLRETFLAQQDLTVSGDFQIQQQGASGSNVPLFRFFDPSGTRLVQVYRQNGTSGAVWVGYGGAFYPTTGTLAMNTWATVSVHVITNGAASTVAVTLNNTQIYQSTTANLGTAGIATVQLGNDIGAQTFSLAADNISVRTAGSASPLALWHMDETSGTVMHDAVGSHNGALHTVQLGLPGFSGMAFGFNGSSSYVSVPSASDLNPGSANITFTIHLKTTGTPPASPDDWDLFRKGLYTTGGGEYKLELVRTGQASCGFEGTGGYAELVAGPAINNGQWHTVSCVKTSTAIQVVVDGQAFSKAAKIGSIANTSSVVIGARPGSDWYKGQLDEASIQIG
jgi:hypothetical protein